MKSNQPILIILIPGFPENEADTTCLPFAQSLIKEINKDFPFLRIAILSFQYPFTKQKYFWHNNLVIPFGGKDKGKLARRILWLRVWRKLKQINDENNIVGLFSFWYGECAFLGNRFGKKFGIKHRCWILGQDAGGYNKYVQKIKPKSEELIAVSDFIADEFFRNYLIRPLHIIPNGIDKEFFNRVPFERTIDIFGAGSLIKLKQFDLFINCIAEVRKDFPEIRSIISGKGTEEKFLSNKIKELNLQSNVVLTGEIQHSEVLKLMQQSRVFLHPSFYEGFSMACLEALYAGCHVISFCKPMNKDFEHWHIVTTIEELMEKSLEILKLADINCESVMPYSIKETAGSIVKLFD